MQDNNTNTQQSFLSKIRNGIRRRVNDVTARITGTNNSFPEIEISEEELDSLQENFEKYIEQQNAAQEALSQTQEPKEVQEPQKEAAPSSNQKQDKTEELFQLVYTSDIHPENYDLVRSLAQNGANLDCTSNGLTLLTAAMFHGDEKMLKLLLEEGANTYYPNDDGSVPAKLTTRNDRINRLVRDAAKRQNPLFGKIKTSVEQKIDTVKETLEKGKDKVPNIKGVVSRIKEKSKSFIQKTLNKVKKEESSEIPSIISSQPIEKEKTEPIEKEKTEPVIHPAEGVTINKAAEFLLHEDSHQPAPTKSTSADAMHHTGHAFVSNKAQALLNQKAAVDDLTKGGDIHLNTTGKDTIPYPWKTSKITQKISSENAFAPLYQTSAEQEAHMAQKVEDLVKTKFQEIQPQTDKVQNNVSSQKTEKEQSTASVSKSEEGVLIQGDGGKMLKDLLTVNAAQVYENEQKLKKEFAAKLPRPHVRKTKKPILRKALVKASKKPASQAKTPEKRGIQAIIENGAPHHIVSEEKAVVISKKTVITTSTPKTELPAIQGEVLELQPASKRTRRVVKTPRRGLGKQGLALFSAKKNER